MGDRTSVRFGAGELLAIVKANPGVSKRDLKRDFGPRALTIAKALCLLGKIESRDRRLYPAANPPGRAYRKGAA